MPGGSWPRQSPSWWPSGSVCTSGSAVKTVNSFFLCASWHALNVDTAAAGHRLSRSTVRSRLVSDEGNERASALRAPKSGGARSARSARRWAMSVTLGKSAAVVLTTTDWTCSRRARPARENTVAQCGQKTSIFGKVKLSSADRGHHVPALRGGMSGRPCLVFVSFLCLLVALVGPSWFLGASGWCPGRLRFLCECFSVTSEADLRSDLRGTDPRTGTSFCQVT